MQTKKSFAVIGLGQFGMAIVEELVALDSDVIAIDLDEERVRKASHLVPTAFVADSTNEKAMRELDIHHVTHAIVAFGDNLQASILTTVILKDMGVEHIVTRVEDEYYAAIMKRLGATDIITPQRAAGIGLANRLKNADFLDYYALGDNFSVVKITVNNAFNPSTIQALNPRNEFGVNLILIKRKSRTFAPKATDYINPGDIVYVVGKRKELETFGSFLNPVEKKE